ncbi:hypothetical protein [Chitinophaga pinensis]|uniref:Restriction endonuclease n=1 Tax=Chitinophaga pinensis (strain ATCC 43595 / DSM 2588 / LMG 13176 / NBRC 15968 / NCIMB 11800 / UQM 2034) TaxID=485918 RepID=A0A979G4Q9_CHIPD|nr:hypothetical protein [Chitinophaga pinensis]ACU60691.1 hypothetical protein Cpin_3224 [Chitinophaga pinensis DSM 2588]
MQQTDQFERYEKEKPAFFQAIRTLEAKHNTSIIEKMKERRYDFDSFRGVMIEVEFGLFLDQFAEKLEYEPNINGKTPDWLATINGRPTIVEVARLKDSAEVAEQSKLDEETGIIHFRLLGSKPQRIFHNVIWRKSDRYANILKSTGYAFIIGIYNTPGSEVRKSDAAQLLHGRSIEYQYSKKIEIDRSDTIFYSENYPDIKAILNGVLWLEQPSFDPSTGINAQNRFMYWSNDNAANSIGEVEALKAIAGRYD